MFLNTVKEHFILNKKDIFIRQIYHIIAGKLYYLEYKNLSTDDKISNEIGIKEDFYRKIIIHDIKEENLSITPNGEVYFKNKNSAMKAADNLMSFINRLAKYIK